MLIEYAFSALFKETAVLIDYRMKWSTGFVTEIVRIGILPGTGCKRWRYWIQQFQISDTGYDMTA